MGDAGNRIPLNNKQVADLFLSIGELLQILGESRFVVLAYQNAARTVGELNEDINSVAAAGGLEELPKIGKAIAAKIKTLLDTGSLPYYDELAAQVPAGVVAMMQVPDVGPKTVQRLWKELDITSVEAMKAAAQAGRLRGMKGFGAKTEERILKSIELLANSSDEGTPIGDARPIAEILVQGLQEGLDPATLEQIRIVGDLGRWRESVGEIELLAACSRAEPALELFQRLPQATSVVDSGAAVASVILLNGMTATLRIVEPSHWGAALCHASGSEAHFGALQELGVGRGWRLDGCGLSAQNHPRFDDGEPRFFDSEEAIYEFLGLQWTPPELREDTGEISAALRQELPQLIAEREILGELHGHTTWSDGKASVWEMAEAARKKGYRYWAVTDHSIGLGVTQGVDADALCGQRREIDAVNERYAADGIDFRLIQGTEVEILSDGTLGLSDAVLATLDVVVASIHSGLRQDRATITARCLKAVDNPFVDILGHPTGRLLGRRPPSAIDLERIMRACAATGTAIEINANPARLDLSAEQARQAVELDCKIAINSDAHSIDQLDLMSYGIHAGRRGWLGAADVINTRPLNELLKLLKRNSSGRCVK